MTTLYDINVKNMKNEEVSLGEYKGKVLLIVNTATGCGFTPQYAGLEELYKKYHDQGLEILDFPCNQFLNQAPGSDEEIHTFCTGRFGVTFPQFSKINVNGKEESPLYSYLKTAQNKEFSGRIMWNFTKFLVNRDGQIVERFGSKTTPEMIEKDIVNLLS